MWTPEAEEAHKAKMKPAVDKLVAALSVDGIKFHPNDELGKNVVLTQEGVEIKMSQHSFYRYSGIANVYKKNDDGSIEIIPVTDEMYLMNFMRPIIGLILNGERAKLGIPKEITYPKK